MINAITKGCSLKLPRMCWLTLRYVALLAPVPVLLEIRDFQWIPSTLPAGKFDESHCEGLRPAKRSLACALNQEL
jgi:hypothetical protein